MGVTSQGSEELKEILRGIPQRLEQNVPALLNAFGWRVAEYARNNHRFTSRSGDLENSIGIELVGNKLRVFLNPEFTTTEKGYDYGQGIHGGTKNKHDQVLWEEDPFLVNAFINSEEAFTEALKETVWRILNMR